jgi:hypothetical protein
MTAKGRLVAAALGTLAIVSFGPIPARADKCTAAKLKAVGKLEASLLACQAKVASTSDASGLVACESKAIGKLSAALAKAGACAGDEIVCSFAAAGCTSGVSVATIDTFPSKCAGSKRKAAGKLASGELGCYSHAAKKSAPVDGTCLTKAAAKFAKSLMKAGACPDGGAPQALVKTDCVGPAVAVDMGNVVVDVCPTPAITSTSTTTLPGGSTTTTSAGRHDDQHDHDAARR